MMCLNLAVSVSTCKWFNIQLKGREFQDGLKIKQTNKQKITNYMLPRRIIF